MVSNAKIILLASLTGLGFSILTWVVLTIGAVLYDDHNKVMQMWPFVVQRAQEMQQVQPNVSPPVKEGEKPSEKKK